MLRNFDMVKIIKTVSKYEKGRGGGPAGATTNALIEKLSDESNNFIVASEPEWE